MQQQLLLYLRQWARYYWIPSQKLDCFTDCHLQRYISWGWTIVLSALRQDISSGIANSLNSLNSFGNWIELGWSREYAVHCILQGRSSCPEYLAWQVLSIGVAGLKGLRHGGPLTQPQGQCERDVLASFSKNLSETILTDRTPCYWAILGYIQHQTSYNWTCLRVDASLDIIYKPCVLG